MLAKPNFPTFIGNSPAIDTINQNGQIIFPALCLKTHGSEEVNIGQGWTVLKYTIHLVSSASEQLRSVFCLFPTALLVKVVETSAV